MTLANNRLRELDFLRGIAILLVFFRHKYLISYLAKMGWIGVDLFFVLSGFLVSNLLFKEYIKFGNIKPSLFLIRRGFKIYPIYYISYLIYLYYKLPLEKGQLKLVLADLIFLQNYIVGFGFAYVSSWSLAIEEHFYLLLVFILYFIYNRNVKIGLSKIIYVILISTLILRIFTNYSVDNDVFKYTMTHLRIDSLFAGVLIAYWCNFKFSALQKFYDTHRLKLYVIAFLVLLVTPFYDFSDSYWVRTFGFSFLYIAFGIILVSFLLSKNINKLLNTFFSAPLVDLISKIGYCSYSIYIIHILVLKTVIFDINYYLLLFLQLAITILIGFFMTYYIEKYFLQLRDKYYPKRSF
ncbi:acyltransferase family protein [Flavobacterium aquatile]|uniref:Acyltransferase 3 domain-containing protein n=1 Tax=Flavobacterium aquatile LMG 4008 = ATCC 11947 TaxID=1453498 RepID=A0A095SU18_9FLAO|nr:acyltransferase [Flavobacterium aquatile]KGD68141.1 hypothetical protein LG45_07550 [Flavobacterium aquatile LMG 4008 = ATCC 11947]OXA68921.1 acyltransferase [Flavobacterium aquatile] [Flavobacterium aquatile LMG 4008 = ATCC 11947]GEC77389.1 acyltransferase [Flavobacterium aquatile]